MIPILPARRGPWLICFNDLFYLAGVSGGLAGEGGASHNKQEQNTAEPESVLWRVD